MQRLAEGEPPDRGESASVTPAASVRDRVVQLRDDKAGCFLAMLLVCIAGPTFAATSLTLDGVWGNEAGCKFAKEGQSEDDSYVVLKSDEVQSYGTGCDWVQVYPGKGGAQVAIGLCGYEGEGGLGAETFVIAPDIADSAKLNITMGPGEPWAVVTKCP